MDPRHADARPPGPLVDSLVVLDACSLQNFAMIGALWVLEARFAGRAAWTEGVRFEVGRGLATEPLLQRVLDLECSWLGPPDRLDQQGDEVVDIIRRGLGGSPSRPLKHLGEAECIRLLERSPATDRVLVTDDRSAGSFARRRPSRIRVLDAAGVLTEAVDSREISRRAADDVIRAMRTRLRSRPRPRPRAHPGPHPCPVRLPAPHREVG